MCRSRTCARSSSSRATAGRAHGSSATAAERPTPPQLQRLFAAPQGPRGLAVGQQAQGVVGQHGEPQRVDLLGRGDEPVAPRLAQQHGGGLAAGATGLEHVAQPPDVRVEGGGRAGARVLAPHGGGEGVGAHDVARLHEQQGERADQPGADQRDGFVGAVDDERPEITEVQHPGACLRPGRGASRHPRPPPHRRPGLSAYVAQGVRVTAVRVSRSGGSRGVVGVGGRAIGHHDVAGGHAAADERVAAARDRHVATGSAHAACRTVKRATNARTVATSNGANVRNRADDPDMTPRLPAVSEQRLGTPPRMLRRCRGDRHRPPRRPRRRAGRP